MSTFTFTLNIFSMRESIFSIATFTLVKNLITSSTTATEARQHFRWLAPKPLCSSLSPHVNYLSILFLPFVVSECSPTMQCKLYWLALWMTCQETQWPNILLNLSQVWTVTREVKFMHPYLRLIAFFLFLVLLSGSPLELHQSRKMAYGPSLTVAVSEEKQAVATLHFDPKLSVQWCWWLRQPHARHFCEYTQKGMENDVFPHFFSQSRFYELVAVCMALITSYYPSQSWEPFIICGTSYLKPFRAL